MSLFCKRGGGWPLWALTMCGESPCGCLDRLLGGGSHCGLFPLNSFRPLQASSDWTMVTADCWAREGHLGCAPTPGPASALLTWMHVGKISKYLCGQECNGISISFLNSLLYKLDKYKIKCVICMLQEFG